MNKQSNDNFINPNELTNIETPEISRIVSVETLNDGQFELEIEASEIERKALCKRFDLVEIEDLTGHLIVTAAPDQSIYHVKGQFESHVVQRCGVTLEPVPAQVKGEYWCDYSEEIQPDDSKIIEFEDDTEDPPEQILDGEFDVGVILTEQFGLELNPFPRAPGADFSKIKKIVGDKLDSENSENPFAVLKNLK